MPANGILLGRYFEVLLTRALSRSTISWADSVLLLVFCISSSANGIIAFILGVDTANGDGYSSGLSPLLNLAVKTLN